MDNEKASDAISNMMNMLKNNSNNNAGGNPSISSDTIANIMKMFQNTNSANNSNNSESDGNHHSSPSFDMEMLLKMKTILEQINNNDDPRTKLLLSLKPYLKESRKNKLDQYIQLFSISKVLDIFSKSDGGDSQK